MRGEKRPRTWPKSGTGDHPRVRGEKKENLRVALATQGSPPRARGKAPKDLAKERDRGSPPRARGKEGKSACCAGYPGITPACAGKSITGLASMIAAKDHPRVRGEKRPHLFALLVDYGSPPRARGKAVFLRVYVAACGITPACAGKSILSNKSHHETSDHPRVRGEKLRRYAPPVFRLGSPPRARGKAGPSRWRPAESRITPACAGKRTPRPAKCQTFWDHPRVRGEKLQRGCSDRQR